MVIQVPGKYHLYGQVHYLSGTSGPLDIPSNSLSVYVYVYNSQSGTEQPVSQSAVSPCADPGRRFEAVLTVTISLDLNRGDAVYLKSSNVTLIHRRSGSTLMGLYKIG